MRVCVTDFPEEAFDWRPAGDDSNSLAILTIHSLHSTRSWLSIATGQPLPERDRDSEFRVSGSSVSKVLALFDDMAADCAKLLEPSETIDWAAIRRTHARPNPDDDMKVPAAWALLHAIEHLREHVGQMQLTRQLWDQTQPP